MISVIRRRMDWKSILRFAKPLIMRARSQAPAWERTIRKLCFPVRVKGSGVNCAKQPKGRSDN